MKGKISFVGVDAPKTVFEFEVPDPERSKAPPGYTFRPVYGSSELLRAQMDRGSLIVRWAWDKKPESGAPEGGFPCAYCGKSLPTKRGLSRHLTSMHGVR